MFGAHIALERVDFLHHVRQHFPSPTHLFLKHHNAPFPAHLASVFNLCPPMLPHVASRQCHLWPSSFSVRPDNPAMGISFRWRVQSNDYVLHLHALAAKTVDTPLAQGARSTDSVMIEYIII